MRRREFMQIEGRTFYGAWVIAPELNGYDIPIAIGAGGGRVPQIRRVLARLSVRASRVERS
jgi:hypothetical protein